MRQVTLALRWLTRHNACMLMPVRLIVLSRRRFGGSELSRGLTHSGFSVGAPHHVKTLGAALFQLWTTAQAASRPILAFRGHRGYLYACRFLR